MYIKQLKICQTKNYYWTAAVNIIIFGVPMIKTINNKSKKKIST